VNTSATTAMCNCSVGFSGTLCEIVEGIVVVVN
jgi:hypothetical protein